MFYTDSSTGAASRTKVALEPRQMAFYVFFAESQVPTHPRFHSSTQVVSAGEFSRLDLRGDSETG